MNRKIIVATILATPFWFVAPAFCANPDHIQQLLKTNQCPQCDLSNANLEDRNLFGANFVNANLRGANLSNSNLGSANFTDANLTGANLSNAYLHEAIFDGTNLSQTDLSNAYLRDTILIDTNFNNANLQDVNLSRTDLSGINLQGVNLSNANLSRTSFMGFDRNNFNSNPTFLNASYSFLGLFYEGFCRSGLGYASLDETQVKEVGLVFADLSGANLEGANLTDALLVGANLSGANLRNANLSDSCLSYAKLNNAILDNANLSNTKLSGAILDNASLQNIKNADLSEAYRTEAEAQAVPKQVDARQYIGSMNRAQQAHYLEYNKFATQIEDLYLGIPTETEFYRYQIVPQADPTQSVMAVAQAKVEGLKSYTGAVFITQLETTGESTTMAYICETDQASMSPPTMPRPPQNSSEDVQCPAGSRLLD